MPQLNLLCLNQRSFSASASEIVARLLTPEPQADRQSFKVLRVDAAVVLFDFDGTLTSIPGEQAKRPEKLDNLCRRSLFLRPQLQKLRDAGLSLGVISKSTEATVVGALEASGLRELFDAPVISKAVGLEGKAGFIVALCDAEGALSYLGKDGFSRVVLVDDDVRELERCLEQGIQTYAAPEDGGLQDRDFQHIFQGLGLDTQLPSRPNTSMECYHEERIVRIWARGLAGQNMEVPSNEAHVDYSPESGPAFASFYSVKVCLTRGAFGKCTSGFHMTSSTPCVVKIMRKEVVGHKYIENFVEQDMYSFLLRMTREEAHTNVVRYLDFLLGTQLIYCVMEELHGPELFDYLRGHAPVTEAFARRMTHEALSALRHIHSACGSGLIHRDVKLENLRFRTTRPDSELVLLDFGLCCPANPDEKRNVVGTKLYVAPEVFSCWYSTQADLWSAGVVLYIVLTGKPPWDVKKRSSFVPDPEVSSGKAVKNALDAVEVKMAPETGVDLLKGLLREDPKDRLDAKAALEHSWFSGGIALRRPARSRTLPANAVYRSHEMPQERIIDVNRASYVYSSLYSKAFGKAPQNAEHDSKSKDDVSAASCLVRANTQPSSSAHYSS